MPELLHARLLSQNRAHEFEIDLGTSSKLMRHLSNLDGISDVEIKKAPIEEIIARLYREWR